MKLDWNTGLVQHLGIEFVEVTPKALRLRKKVLQSNKRKKSVAVMVEEGK